MFEQKDALIIYGMPDDEEIFLKFLERDKTRVLILEEDFAEEESPLLSHKRCERHLLKTPLEQEILLKKILWELIFLEIEVVEGRPSPSFPSFQKKILYLHEGIHYTASDYSDFGEKVFTNIFQNLQEEVIPWEHLEGAFEGLPIGIIGAGPSLEEEIEILRKKEFVLFAGGSALNVLAKHQITPHFAASIDKDAPFSTFKHAHLFDVPFFFQMRANAQNVSSVQGKKILVPSSGGYPLEDWIMKKSGFDQNPIDGGWNVASFMTKVAHFLGFSPIILIGMDLAHAPGKTYAEGCALPDNQEYTTLETTDMYGNPVRTQRDWLFCKDWFQNFAKTHPGVLKTATKKGLGFGDFVPKVNLEEVQRNFPIKPFCDALLNHPASTLDQSALKSVRKSVRLTEVILDEMLEKLETAFVEKEELPENFSQELEEELFYQKHLLPIWRVYAPIFQREVTDQAGLLINELLFYQKITKGFPC